MAFLPHPAFRRKPSRDLSGRISYRHSFAAPARRKGGMAFVVRVYVVERRTGGVR